MNFQMWELFSGTPGTASTCTKSSNVHKLTKMESLGGGFYFGRDQRRARGLPDWICVM